MTTLAIPRSFYRSNLTQKAVMAVTGAILFLFVVGHLLGNLQIFVGRERLNAYAEFLKSTGEGIWVARIALLVALVLHICAAVQVTLANWRARPIGYAYRKNLTTTYAARTMIISGPLLLLYVIYHLMMFTFLLTDASYSHTDVYGNVIRAFKVPGIAAVYIVAMLLLGLHLYHGFWSMLHTTGVSRGRYGLLRRLAAPVIAVLITAGYISIPLAVLTGLLK